ncbi:carboxylating nicotinate-nucleotide diphosphorylase [Leptothoe spongobia]|uniref:Probable nicotinate-nucleotide pyrophosphorylase [carboxylating] n=1 Tax=Leptothoe spongobia TAU-MAC 1115 TaxID=1967444 RepID=A0A947GK22_9CYAN|nr:carboxylating nicotinate-nucleotide diphosphorylase [Leptothoe spongobia]MBT9317004.1 carboxylating nicotinate-nucleotide diphosphorylase [Leptothoe spongobia TAU-MAC 1115]
MNINWISLNEHLKQWLQEDIGRSDQTTIGLANTGHSIGKGYWLAKGSGVICGMPIAERVFQILSDANKTDKKMEFKSCIAEGTWVTAGTTIAQIQGTLAILLTGERVALNLAMHLSGIATATREYVNAIADLPTQLVDTRKTTPGLRTLEKYAVRMGGACNHRMGLDDGVMIKDNHIAAAGGIREAIKAVRSTIPYPLTVEVETENLEQVQEALDSGADIIMLDNMAPFIMAEAVKLIRRSSSRVKIEGSGNVTLQTIREIALTGVDYISSSAPITRSPWLDLSMRIES